MGLAGHVELADQERRAAVLQMDVIASALEFSSLLEARRAHGDTVALVPTMGALHAGHESLVRRAVSECDVAAVSIFVNPLQFVASSDLEHYPRSFEFDLAVCRSLGVSVVFAPSVTEMYPNWPQAPATVVSVPSLASRWEGASRPGHFDGVAMVVAKLFALAGHCRAYFGEKDFQQLVLVRQLVVDLGFAVEVLGCPIVREDDGLALSSRNARLSAEERRAATILWRALHAASSAVSLGERRPDALATAMASVVDTEPTVLLDYAAVVDPDRLDVPELLDHPGPWRLIIAAQVGPVRLIDNMSVRAPSELSPSARHSAFAVNVEQRQ